MHARLIRSTLLAVLLGVSLGVGAAMPSSVTSPTVAQKNTAVRSNASRQVDTSPTAAQLDQSALVVVPPPILRNTGRIVLTPDKPLLGHLNLKSPSVRGLLVEAPPALQPPPYEAALSMGTGNSSSMRSP